MLHALTVEHLFTNFVLRHPHLGLNDTIFAHLGRLLDHALLYLVLRRTLKAVLRLDHPRLKIAANAWQANPDRLDDRLVDDLGRMHVAVVLDVAEDDLRHGLICHLG